MYLKLCDVLNLQYEASCVLPFLSVCTCDGWHPPHTTVHFHILLTKPLTSHPSFAA